MIKENVEFRMADRHDAAELKSSKVNDRRAVKDAEND
jgi:hypothetical protein